MRESVSERGKRIKGKKMNEDYTKMFRQIKKFKNRSSKYVKKKSKFTLRKH